MAIDSSKIREEIWNIFINLVKNNVTSVTIKGSSGPNTKTVTIQNYSQAFPDELFDTKDSYPMLVVNSPDIRTSPVTYRNREVEGTISFEVYTLQSESADKFADKIISTVISNEDTLRAEGLDNLEIDSSDSAHYDRNKLNVHARMVVLRFVAAI
jgi:hypothetical protein